MSRLPSVLSYPDLPEAELHAAKLDGELYRVDQCFSPVDEIETSELRARALLLTIPSRLIVEQRSAAWIYGATTLPSTHQFCTAVRARAATVTLVRLKVREVVIFAGDQVSIAGLSVTTPLRTVVDLARHSPVFDNDEFRMVGALLRIGGLGFADCRAVLDRHRNLPHKALALIRIEEAIRRIEVVHQPTRDSDPRARHLHGPTDQPPLTR
jgi:hypothetical protein